MNPAVFGYSGCRYFTSDAEYSVTIDTGLCDTLKARHGSLNVTGIHLRLSESQQGSARGSDRANLVLQFSFVVGRADYLLDAIRHSGAALMELTHLQLAEQAESQQLYAGHDQHRRQNQ